MIMRVWFAGRVMVEGEVPVDGWMDKWVHVRFFSWDGG